MFLKISENPQENTCVRVSFLIKLYAWGPQLYQKRGSCKFWEIFKNSFFYRTPSAAASEHNKSIWKVCEAVAQRYSVKKVFLEISQNSQENTCARVSFLIKFLRPANLLKKRLWDRCFPMNFAKFLRTPFFTEHLWWLLLNLVWCFVIVVFISDINVNTGNYFTH